MRRFDSGMFMPVNATNDIAEFLATRRARISPGQAGLPSYGKRRVPGLRREEVASLARAANPVLPKPARPVKTRIRAVVQRTLDQIAAPATVRNARLDYVGASALGRALYAPLFDSREQPANSARFTFLDPAAVKFYPEWERLASELVADDGLSIAVFTAESGSASQQALDLLASWTATPDAAHEVRRERTPDRN